MTTIQTFNRSNVQSMRMEIEAALKTVSAKYNVTVGIGRITFTANEMRCKLTAVAGTGASAGAPAAAPNAIPMAALMTTGVRILGITVNELRNEYTVAGVPGPVTLVGYMPRRFKYPFTVRTRSGKQYKISTYMAQSMLKNPVAKAA